MRWRRLRGPAPGRRRTAGPSGPGSDAARHRRPGSLPEIACAMAYPRGHADRAGRGDRPRGRLRDRRRRLRNQAIQPPRAGPAGPVRAAPRPGRRSARPACARRHQGRQPRGRPGRALGDAGRERAVPDLPGVRPPGVPHGPSPAGVQPGAVAGARVGLDLRRHLDRHRPHPAAAGKDRAGPDRAPADRHRLGCRLPLRTGRSMTGIDAPTLWQGTYTVAGVAVASAAAGLLSVRLLDRRSLATLLFVVAAVVIVSSMAGVGVIAYKMMISVDDRNVVLA